MKIYFIGFMGSGKTFWAKTIAEKHSLRYIDIDKEIEKQSKLIIEEIFAQYGESYFRKLESNFLMNSFFDGIIATGGGIIENPLNREFLKKHITIWIDTKWEIIYNRIKDSNRPLVKKHSKKALYLLWEKRRQFYNECATYIISSNIERELDKIFE